MAVDDQDQTLLIAGRGAFDQSDWRAAFDDFSRVDAGASLDADDLERFAQAAMWLGEFQACVDKLEEAFALRVAGDDVEHAARLAMELCRAHAVRQRMAVAVGWFQRAERLLEGLELCAELGWLAELRGIVALHLNGDLAAADEQYGEALRVGRLCGDRDLAAVALAGLGTIRVRVGDVAAGLRLVDEAMIDAVTGALGAVTTARIYCNTISLCQALGDVRRAYEWTEEATACSRRPGMSDFPGDCRLHRAELTRLRGDWSGAENELHRVMSELERWDLAHVGQAWYELGEIALRRGDLVASEEAFDRSAGYGKDPQPGLARLRLAQGDEGAALALLQTATANVGDVDPLALGQLLPAVVEAHLACGDVAGAAEAAERLADLAATYGTVVFQATTAVARARVALAQDECGDAATRARTAISLWRDAGAPYETAQAQRLFAEAASRVGDRPIAIVELESALASFNSLGAAGDVEAAQRLRDRLGDQTTARKVCRTFMFTDIVDSTRLVAAMGDESWSAVLRWHDRTIRDLLARHRGAEVKQRGGGDGFFAAFAAPGDAISCAVAIQQQFAEHRDTNGFAPEVRIGVHQADALLSGNDFAGLGVHEAARIAGLAGGGEILASQSTVMSAAVTTAGPARHVALKGIADGIAVQKVAWTSAPERKPPT